MYVFMYLCIFILSAALSQLVPLSISVYCKVKYEVSMRFSSRYDSIAGRIYLLEAWPSCPVLYYMLTYLLI